MAAEYGTILSQTIPVNGSAVFTESPVPCNRGLIYHRDGSGLFRLASPSIIGCGYRSGCCCNMPTANYTVSFHGTIQVPEGGTAGTISLAIFVDGEEDFTSVMSATPAAAEEPFTVGSDIVVAVPWICRCGSVSVRNVGDIPLELLSGNIVFSFDGIQR